jgi:hypothetical protein
VLALASLILTVTWLPESARFYYGRKRFREAAAVMTKIAQENLGKTLQFEFRAETQLENQQTTLLNTIASSEISP